MKTKYKIKVTKGMIFDGYNGQFYEVLSDSVLHTDTNDVYIVLNYMLDQHIIRYVGLHKYKELIPHKELMFRVGVLINDDELLMSVGTFTWMDDINHMALSHLILVDEESNAMLVTLRKLLDYLNDPDVNDARETMDSVDVMYTAILDAAYELYEVLVERMLTI